MLHTATETASPIQLEEQLVHRLEGSSALGVARTPANAPALPDGKPAAATPRPAGTTAASACSSAATEGADALPALGHLGMAFFSVLLALAVGMMLAGR